MKVEIVLLIALGFAFVGAFDNEKWANFKSRFAKRYSNLAEERRRRATWEATMKFVEEHNRLYAQGLKSFTVAENQFADMDDDEYKRTMLMARPIEKIDHEGGIPHREFYEATKRGALRGEDDLPVSIDWRAVAAVHPVKNQRTCGSCFAFAAMGALESHWKLYSKLRNLPTLSEQEVVDCSRPDNNHGCDGGLAYKCYNYVKRNGRVSKDAAYPYEALNATCRVDNSPETFGASLADYAYTKEQDEKDMMHALATQGPISIHADASPRSFKQYDGTIGEGVWDEQNCITNASNHAMLAVGYGVTPGGVPYWIIKNSWGDKWGLNGYVLIRRGKNTCAIEWYGGEYPIIYSSKPSSAIPAVSASKVVIFLFTLAAYFII